MNRDKETTSKNERRCEIIIKGRIMHLILGKTIHEWSGLDNFDLWDILLEEIIDGSVEVNEDIWYWLIGDRVYETEESVN